MDSRHEKACIFVEVNVNIFCADLEAVELNSRIFPFESYPSTGVNLIYFLGVANDIRTSLKNIYSAFEIIVNGEANKLSNNGKALVRKIQGALQKMNLLTSDVLSYLQIPSGKIIENDVSLDHVADQVLAEFAEIIAANNIQINKGTLGAVKGDFYSIYILLRHLIGNAIKFRKANHAHVIQISSIIWNSDTDLLSPGTLKLIIRNNGMGLSAEDGDNIFSLFYKNHQGVKMKGSGVGLAIARKIMSVHGGSISVEEERARESLLCATFHCHALR